MGQLDNDIGELEDIRWARVEKAVEAAKLHSDVIVGIKVRLTDASVGRAQDARPKPSPDLVLAAAETLRVSPAHCLVIEDSAVGVDAARAAGMRVIAITTTDVEKNLARADAIYKGFAEIQERIDSALS